MDYFHLMGMRIGVLFAFRGLLFTYSPTQWPVSILKYFWSLFYNGTAFSVFQIWDSVLNLNCRSAMHLFPNLACLLYTVWYEFLCINSLVGGNKSVPIHGWNLRSFCVFFLFPSWFLFSINVYCIFSISICLKGRFER